VEVSTEQNDENVEFLLSRDDIAALDDPLEVLKVLRRDLALERKKHLVGKFGRNKRLGLVLRTSRASSTALLA